MELKSERIILRPLSREDAPAILDYRADPECYRFQTWQPETLADVEQFIAQRIVAEPDVPGTWFQLAICRRESGEVMGDCGIHFLADEPRQVEIGITLRRECQGMGYASETLHLVFTYVFGSLGKHRVIASVDPDNHASLRLLERMGMRREAHFVESLWCKDHWADDVVYALLAREWQARWLIEPVIEGGN